MSSMTENNLAECAFCQLREGIDRPLLVRSKHFFAVKDKFPVNVGHTLLIPFRHVSRMRELAIDEFIDLKEILQIVQDDLEGQKADGFNIGVNEGEVAGQTIAHLHIHVIPRYRGDVESPRGGIRNLKTSLVEY
jgi:diadenosine tetraphosphate (Ap4A) HIT family hydrolase